MCYDSWSLYPPGLQCWLLPGACEPCNVFVVDLSVLAWLCLSLPRPYLFTWMKAGVTATDCDVYLAFKGGRNLVFHWVGPSSFLLPPLYKTLVFNNNNNNHIQRRNSRFLTISSLRHELFPTYTLKWAGRNHVQITWKTWSTYYMQHAMLHATWDKGTAQLLRQSLNHIYFSFI